MRRISLIISLALAAPALAGPPPPPMTIVQRSLVNVGATTTDQNGASFTITGMSGIAFRGGTEYLAVMDNSNKVVRLTVNLGPDGSIISAGNLGGYTLGTPYDHEGIAFLAGPASSILIASEVRPGIDEYALPSGTHIRSLTIPQVFSSVRPNFGFESLSLRPNAPELWTANEEALSIDGPLSSQSSGTTVRVQRFFSPTLTPASQFAYPADPWHGSAITSARSGVSDLVALPTGHLLALERSFAFSTQGFFKSTITLINATGATDTSALILGLATQPHTPALKQPLWSGLLNQNLEGLCLGPYLGNNHWALIGVADDADPISTNAVVSFDLYLPGYCRTDINADSAITVQDIFDYLNLWFQGHPFADLGPPNSPGISVGDIFDYLNAWLSASCP